MNLGMKRFGLEACTKAMITDRLLDSNPLFLTGNTDTVYVSVMLDLDRDGPTVVEIQLPVLYKLGNGLGRLEIVEPPHTPHCCRQVGH